MDNFSLQFIIPEIILTLAALVVLMAGMDRQKSPAGILSLAGIIVSACFLPFSSSAGPALFSGMLVNDGFSMFFRLMLLLMTGMITLLSMGYKDLPQEDKAEYYFFLLVITAAMMLAVAANNLMMIYITLETISIISYIMAGFLKRDIFSSEAGVKYFLFGALSTGITLYGVSWIYGLFGTLDLALMKGILAAGGVSQMPLCVALILVFVGFAFKCSLAPFHMWTPDVYEGAPTPVAAFLSVAPKSVGFAFLLRVFVENCQSAFLHWTSLAGVIALLSMTIGNVLALKQENIKRLLAYSTIAQAGYIFVGLAIGTPAGIKASLFYIFIYTVMNIGAFGAVIAVANTIKSANIGEYAGMYQRDPVTAAVLAVSLLSLAGIPPLAGFLAKFFILASAVEARHVVLAIGVVLNSLIALYYYARIIKVMFLEEPEQTGIVPRSIAIQLVLIVTVTANLFIGLWPQLVINPLMSLLHWA